MKITTLQQVNERAADGRVYAAMEGTSRVVDDADTDIVNLMRSLAARGLISIDDDKADDGETLETAETPGGSETLEVDEMPGGEPEPEATKAEMQAELADRELPTSGTKPELAERLAEADAVDELAAARADAEAAGVKVDGRWGVERIRAAIADGAKTDADAEAETEAGEDGDA